MRNSSSGHSARSRITACAALTFTVLALASFGLAGCQSDDSTPLPPAVDAASDHTASGDAKTESDAGTTATDGGSSGDSATGGDSATASDGAPE